MTSHSSLYDTNQNAPSPHSFHIPVMGTGFSIDTPLKVAQYGISSVVSIGDDILIEQMRKYHSEKNGIDFEPIPVDNPDYRSHRITAYLNLLKKLISEKIEKLANSPFEKGSQIVRYFELLPEGPARALYQKMKSSDDETEKSRLQQELKKMIRPGSIDVNIMVKVDTPLTVKGKELAFPYSLAHSSLKGYAESELNSSIILSAGINNDLYNYMAEFPDFFPDENSRIKKKVAIKVSDYRSALVQSRFLIRKGIWISEFRIESGLNCGGHAFPTKGQLLGPILEQFKDNRSNLIEKMFTDYNRSLKKSGHATLSKPPETKITVQGGICSSEENNLLFEHYKVDGTGWGTPFLLVPEVTNVDKIHLQKLALATRKDVFLSNSSPFGVPFWNLSSSHSEEARRIRIRQGKPGSTCVRGFLKMKNDVTEHRSCTASRTYQKIKLSNLIQNSDNPKKKFADVFNTMSKSCICMDLTGSATLKLGIDTNVNPAICCGPSIEYFDSVYTLETMVDHIYGRKDIPGLQNRPSFLIRELQLYIDYYRSELEKTAEGIIERTTKYLVEFKKNLFVSIEHYQALANEFEQRKRDEFTAELDNIFLELENIAAKYQLKDNLLSNAVPATG